MESVCEDYMYYDNYSVFNNIAYLAGDISISEQLTILCSESVQPGMTLRGWSHSPDGSSTLTLIDTSSSKYAVNGNTLAISNISSSDEGLYRCIYDQGEISGQSMCVYVYGKFTT